MIINLKSGSGVCKYRDIMIIFARLFIISSLTIDSSLSRVCVNIIMQVHDVRDMACCWLHCRDGECHARLETFHRMQRCFVILVNTLHTFCYRDDECRKYNHHS